MLEQKEQVSDDIFNQLIQQLYKKQWKIVVQQMKKLLATAKHEGNTTKAEEIMSKFQQLKQKILPSVGQKTQN